MFSFTWLALIAGMGVEIGQESGLIGFAPLDEPHAAAPALVPSAPIVATDADVHILAATAWAEARSEGEEGMRAVAHVIVNRVGPRFGESVNEVARRPWQFSAWNRGDPNRPLAQNPERYAQGGINKETWETAQKVAREVLEGRSVDPTEGALFYHTTAISPYWADAGVSPRTIGNHIFYADVGPTRVATARSTAERLAARRETSRRG